MIAYFDTSAFAKLMLDEPGSDAAVALWDSALVVTSSLLAYAEMRAALAGAARSGRVSRSAAGRTKDDWGAIWSQTRSIHMTDQMVLAAGDLAETYALRGSDAVHLASALTLGIEDVFVASWDRRLRTGAAALGFTVAPREI